MLSPGQSARMSKITNNGLTRVKERYFVVMSYTKVKLPAFDAFIN